MGELWDIMDENRNKTGRLHERGKLMRRGECHLVVQIWIVSSEGTFLISKRSPGINGWANLWQTTGGSAVAGDDSLSAALRETKEELGIDLLPKNGQLFKQYGVLHNNDEGKALMDVWLFRQEVDISDVIFQPEETCDAMWASKERILHMIAEGTFIPPDEAYPYINELFAFCEL